MKTLEISAFVQRLLVLSAFLLAGFAIYTARDVVYSLLLSGLLVAIISPVLTRAEQRGIPTWIAVSGLYLIALGFWLLMLFAVIPLLSKEFVHFAGVLRDGATHIMNQLNAGDIGKLPVFQLLNASGIDVDPDMVVSAIKENSQEILNGLSNTLMTVATGLGSSLLGIFGTISTLSFTLVLTFFLALERVQVYDFLKSHLPKPVAKRIEWSSKQLDRVFLVWLRGQFFLSLSIFLATYVGLFVLEWVFGINIRGHFSLALIAGMFEVVPIIGPILASIPAIIIAFSLGPVAVGAVVVLYVIIQQIENLFLVPRIQGDALELSSFTVLVCMAIAGSLFGVIGVLLVLPVLAAIKVLYFPSAEPFQATPSVKKPKNLKK